MQQGNTLETLPLDGNKPRAALDSARKSLGSIILGKDREISLALACLLAKGHLLIEDLPGLGKTILAQSLARVLGLRFQRIQFTSDLLPADIVGVSIFRQESGQFEFQQGPIFAELVLADEVNRATPRHKARCWKRWKNARCQLTEIPTHYPQPTSSLPRKTRRTKSAHFHYPNRNSIDS